MRKRFLVFGVLSTLWLTPVTPARAAERSVPDLTKGEKKDDTPDWNLGPTGATGWIFGRGFSTAASRQILVGHGGQARAARTSGTAEALPDRGFP
jgi:hypothetical protein